MKLCAGKAWRGGCEASLDYQSAYAEGGVKGGEAVHLDP